MVHRHVSNLPLRATGDQNRNTRRTVTESYIQDVRNRALGRTLMLTFTSTQSSLPARRD